MLIKRNQYLENIRRFYESNLIKVLTGVRRCGKSVLLNQIKEELINEKNIREDHIISINFEDVKFSKINNFNKYKKNIVADSDMLKLLPEEIDPASVKDDWDKVAALKRLLDSDSSTLKDNEKIVLKMIFENPNITQREMSERMGFHFASGTGAILNRLRRRIKEEGILDDV